MKKIFLFLAVASGAFFASCSNDDDRPDNDTIGRVIETQPLNFNSQNSFTNFLNFPEPTFDGDAVLVYRRLVVDGFVVWQQIPRTVYPSTGGEVDYDFNFTPQDIEIFMQSDDIADLNNLPQYTQGQVFRIVLLPAEFVQTVDTDNYDAVMSAVQEYNNGGVPSIQK